MPDVIRLILDDHESFRARFAELEGLRDDPTAAEVLWLPLAADLEVHASAEEVHFYPELLRRIGKEEETEDAVGDHDDIRAGVRRAAAAEAGSAEWWAAIDEARRANDHHLAEEESDDIAPFLEKVSQADRDEIGERFAAYQREHAHGAGLDYSDRDAEQYMKEHT